MHASLYLWSPMMKFFSSQFCFHMGKEFQKNALPTLFHFVRVRAALQPRVTIPLGWHLFLDYPLIVLLNLQVGQLDLQEFWISWDLFCGYEFHSTPKEKFKLEFFDIFMVWVFVGIFRGKQEKYYVSWIVVLKVSMASLITSFLGE